MIWYYMILYYIIWYDIIWYDIISYDMILYDMILYYMIWYYMIWYYMIWYDITWYDIIWYDMILHDMILYYIIFYRCIHTFDTQCKYSHVFGLTHAPGFPLQTRWAIVRVAFFLVGKILARSRDAQLSWGEIHQTDLNVQYNHDKKSGKVKRF